MAKRARKRVQKYVADAWYRDPFRTCIGPKADDKTGRVYFGSTRNGSHGVPIYGKKISDTKDSSEENS